MDVLNRLFWLAAAWCCAATLARGEVVRSNQGDCLVTPVPFTWSPAITSGPVGQTAANCTTTPCGYQVDVASLFRIDYGAEYKVVRNYLTSEVFVLYICGTPQPSPLLFQDDMAANLTVKYFETPLTSVTVGDSTALYFMETLGVSDRINSITPYTAVSPCATMIVNSVPKSGCGREFSEKSDPAANIDGFFSYSDVPIAAPYTSKTIPVSAVADAGALQRAEWLAFVAAFFNREDVAAAKFADIKAAFDLAAVPETAAASGPSILWVRAYQDVTGYGYVDASGTALSGPLYTISFTNYKVDLSTAAGASTASFADWNAAQTVPVQTTYAPSPNDVLFSADAWGGLAEVMAVIKPLLQKTEIVIDETYYFTQPPSLEAAFMAGWNISTGERSQYPFLQNGRLWMNDKARGADSSSFEWFSTAVGRPDLVLQDLRRIVDPTSSDRVPYFFRNASANEPFTTMSGTTCSASTLTCSSFSQQAAISPFDTLEVLTPPSLSPSPAPATTGASPPSVMTTSGAVAGGLLSASAVAWVAVVLAWLC